MNNDNTPKNIQRATVENPVIELRNRLRGAPPEIRKRIDAARIAGGLTPIWQSVPTPAKTTTRATTTKAKPAAAATIATLVLACAPGLSRPVALVGQTEELPEFITQRAWRGVLQQIATGKPAATVQVGHQAGARIITHTASPRVRTKLCPTVGLCLFVDVRASDPYIIRTASCSISFRPTSYHTENVGGQRVRFIDAMKLEHIAIIEGTSTDSPIYPMARVRRCTPKAATSGMTDLLIDVGCLVRASWPELKPLTRG
jgi:hypothetical protein